MPSSQNCLVIGASRGLGLGFARSYLEAGAKVTATARNPAKAGDLSALKAEYPDHLAVEALEMTDVASGAALAQRLSTQQFDIIIFNAGVFGPEDQSPLTLTAQQISDVMMTNAFGPVRLAEQLKNLIKADGVFVFLTSLMGSIADNKSGGYGLYRASKSALNMLTNNFYKSLGQKPNTVLAMHPGWVKTDMGGPHAPLDIDTSVAGMVRTIAAQRGSCRHLFVDYEGKSLPW